jgi:2-oxo-4-hydroxy-4-carboxy-5-ureidoimidazoline decarboxylase
MKLDALDTASCTEALLRCCGSRRWAAAMAAARPFASAADLHEAALRIWNQLEPADWREAFAAHPRIGGKANSAWSRAEQAGAANAGDAVREELARMNADYERRFGHVFLICASGRSAEEMLAELRRRIHHSPSEELHLAAAEQAKITRLRLDKLLAE